MNCVFAVFTLFDLTPFFENVNDSLLLRLCLFVHYLCEV